jgi:hypothetical protein
MVQFRFFHTALAIRIGEELEHGIEGLFRIVDDVGERLPLPIRQELLSGDTDLGHVRSPLLECCILELHNVHIQNL